MQLNVLQSGTVRLVSLKIEFLAFCCLPHAYFFQGKTCMLISYAKGKFPDGYVPTIFDNYVVNVTVGNGCCELSLFDTAGQESYDKLRTLSYAETDVFLVCFSVVWPSSLVNVEHEWLKELKDFNKNSIIMLVGTKIDLRNDPNEIENLAKSNLKPLTREDGEYVVKKYKLYKYVECSAKTRFGLKEVFDEAIRAVYIKNSKKSSGCFVL